MSRLGSLVGLEVAWCLSGLDGSIRVSKRCIGYWRIMLLRLGPRGFLGGGRGKCSLAFRAQADKCILHTELPWHNVFHGSSDNIPAISHYSGVHRGTPYICDRR